MTTVAERYSVSSNYLARICEQLKVPRPPRGYWARRAVGQVGEQPPLTPLDPGDETMWIRGGGESLSTASSIRVIPAQTA